MIDVIDWKLIGCNLEDSKNWKMDLGSKKRVLATMMAILRYKPDSDELSRATSHLCWKQDKEGKDSYDLIDDVEEAWQEGWEHFSVASKFLGQMLDNVPNSDADKEFWRACRKFAICQHKLRRMLQRKGVFIVDSIVPCQDAGQAQVDVSNVYEPDLERLKMLLYASHLYVIEAARNELGSDWIAFLMH